MDEKIIFGGGCFWCLDAIFKRVEGVTQVISGYSGGNSENPTYEEICSGKSGHAEVVSITFENEKIGLVELLDIFWQIHDPTTLNRQGNDIGTQYRSIIFYINESQKEIIQNSLKKQNNLTIVTEILPLEKFYPAEDYHQNYYENNLTQPYCVFVISPKIKKFEDSSKNN